MGDILDEIKNISFKFLESKYKNYLKEKEILLVKEENMKNMITSFYDNYSKELKQTIRITLKKSHKDNYPNTIVENSILDIFQDKELNINRICDEFIILQKKHHYKISLPLVNKSLNLNIGIADNFIIINSVNPKKIEDNSLNEIYNIINNYKFLYSIETLVLEEYTNEEKINIIKKTLTNKEKVNIELYYLKN
tara:strand:+ start:87 stop:668 length:582 start_codon:yes stop_codon:yes gene_type:complete